MQAVDIVNRLKEILPKFTDDFSDISTVTSLTRSGSTITAVTPSAHGLTTGDYVTIRGAKEPITLSSLTRVGGVVTATSSTDHKLSDPSLYALDQLPLYVEISGATPSDYNGTFKLLTVPTGTTFTFEITTTPATPATVAGYLLLEDQDGFNGYKQITVTTTTAFTYTTTNTSLGSPAQGTLQLSSGTRVDYAATPLRISQYYSENASGILKNWMFVVLGATSIYKNNTIASDLSAAKQKNENYWYESQRDLSIYVALSSKTSTLGGAQSDTARSYEVALLKSLANYVFDSALTEGTYQPLIYVANETDDYVDAYYTHRFDFLAKGFVQIGDTAAFSNGVPLQVINGTITDKGMTYKPTTRILQ